MKSMIELLRDKLPAFWADEDGQATAEYILMLSFAISMAVLVMQQLVAPAFQKLSNFLTTSITNQLIRSDLHTFNMGQ